MKKNWEGGEGSEGNHPLFIGGLYPWGSPLGYDGSFLPSCVPGRQKRDDNIDQTYILGRKRGTPRKGDSCDSSLLWERMSLDIGGDLLHFGWVAYGPIPCNSDPAAPDARDLLPIEVRENVYFGGIRQGVGDMQPPTWACCPSSCIYRPAIYSGPSCGYAWA